MENFAGQWLQLRNLRNVQPNTDLFPDFDDNLRQSFRRETELLFESIVQEDRSVLDLLTADYTFVNERLARHYGIPDIYGSRFRRVAVTDDARRGLLGTGQHSGPDFARRADLAGGARQMDSRKHSGFARAAAAARMCRRSRKIKRDRNRAPCANRWPSIAPTRRAPAATRRWIRSVSRWRISMPWAHGAPRMPAIRSTHRANCADGTHVDGVVTLRQALVSRPELFAGTMTEKLLIYALGRGLDYRDMPAVRAILRDAARDNYRFSALILGVVHSTPFQMRTAVSEGETRRCSRHKIGKGIKNVPDEEIVVSADHVARCWALRWRCRCWTRCCPPSYRWPKPPRSRACDSARSIFRTARSCSNSLPRRLAQALSSRRF